MCLSSGPGLVKLRKTSTNSASLQSICTHEGINQRNLKIWADVADKIFRAHHKSLFLSHTLLILKISLVESSFGFFLSSWTLSSRFFNLPNNNKSLWVFFFVRNIFANFNFWQTATFHTQKNDLLGAICTLMGPKIYIFYCQGPFFQYGQSFWRAFKVDNFFDYFWQELQSVAQIEWGFFSKVWVRTHRILIFHLMNFFPNFFDHGSYR